MALSRTLLRACAIGGLALAGAALPATPAGAQKCTLGVDTNRLADRPPAACEIFGLGAPASAPTRGADGAVWSVSNGQVVRQFNGETQRYGLTGRLAAILGRVGLEVGTSPAGVALAAGPIVQTIGPDGLGSTVLLPAAAVGAPAAVGALLVVPTGAGLAVSGADGRATLIPTPGAAPTGDAVAAHDGAVWFAAGAAVARRGADGSLERYGVGHAVKTIAPAHRDDGGGVWVAAADASEVLHVGDDGDIDKRYTVPGRPTGITAGEGRHTIWVATADDDYVARIATKSFPGGYQKGLPCPRKVAAACQDSVKATPEGFQTIYNPPAPPVGLALGDDGRVYTGSGDGLFAVRTSRPMIACEKRSRAIGGPHGAYACQDGTWQTFVNGKAAYPRISCLRLNFRYCAGRAILRYKGKVLGTTSFVVLTYDNPDLRIPIGKATYRMMKRAPGRQIRAEIELRSRDGGGILRVTKLPIVLFVGVRDRAASLA